MRGRLSNLEFRVSSDQAKAYGKVAECLFVKKLCVIPPTIHPDTGLPYRWIGAPLHEVDFNELPIVEMRRCLDKRQFSIGLLREVFTSEFVPPALCWRRHA